MRILPRIKTGTSVAFEGIVVLGLSLVHFLAAAVCMTRAPEMANRTIGGLTSFIGYVLLLPMVAVRRGIAPYMLNSLLWGIGMWFVLRFLLRNMHRKKEIATTNPST